MDNEFSYGADMRLVGFVIATAGIVNFFTGNFIVGVVLFVIGTGMMPNY